MLLGKAKALDKALRCLGVGTARANNMDDLVDVVEGKQEAFEDMCTRLGLGQVVAGTTCNYIYLVVDIVLKHLFKRKGTRNTVDQGKVNNAKARLERGVLIEVIENNLGDSTLLKLDHQTQTLAVGLVAHVRNSLDALLVNEFGDLLLQGSLVYLVGELGKDELRFASFGCLYMSLGAQGNNAAASGIGVANTVGTHDDSTSWEVGARQNTHKVVNGAIGVVDHHAGGVDSLAEVVWRNVCCHTNCDTCRTINEQVGEASWQNRRLFKRLVVVGVPIYSVFVEVAKQLHRRLCQARLGVAHSCCGVAVDVAKVTVTIDQGNSHREPLRKANHRIVDRRVAVGVVLTNNFADRPSGLLVRLIREDASLVHGVENTAVYWL